MSAAVAVALDLLATARGPGLSPDSVEYLSAGVGLAEGRGLQMLNGNAWTLFPPGLPVVVASGDVVGLSAETSVRLFTAACFAVMPVLTYLLLRKLVQSPALRVGGTVLVAVSPAMLNVSSMAWSEAPFIVVTLLFALVAGGIWERGTLTLRDAAVLVVLCWLAFALRYAGVALIVAGVVAFVLCLEPKRRPRTLAHVGGFAVAAAAFPVAWMLRNHAADGNFLGPRAASPDSVVDVVRSLVKTTGGWLLPTEALPLGLRGLVAVGAVGCAAVLLFVWHRRAAEASPDASGSRACPTRTPSRWWWSRTSPTSPGRS